MSDADDDDCKRGKRGHRGHRGRRGHDGDPGPTVSGGLLKFSGTARIDPNGSSAFSFLADVGVDATIVPLAVAPSYAVAAGRSLRNLAVNIMQFVVPPGGSIIVELIDKNGNLVPGFTVTYTDASVMPIQTAVAGPAPFAIGDTFNLRIATSGLGTQEQLLRVAATVGVE